MRYPSVSFLHKCQFSTFCISALKNDCFSFLVKVVNPKNAITLQKVADLYDNAELMSKSNKIIWEEFPKVENDFKELIKEELDYVMSLRKNENVRVHG